MLDKTKDRVTAWQRKTFPKTTAKSLVSHLLDEVIELEEAVDWPRRDAGENIREELADIMILMVGILDKFDLDADEIVNEKMDINDTREWHEPDTRGVYKHVEASRSKEIDDRRMPTDEMIRVSPSQIDSYRDCRRKWAFGKIDRVPRQSSLKAQFGSAAHAGVEAWTLTKVLPPPGVLRETIEALAPHTPRLSGSTTVALEGWVEPIVVDNDLALIGIADARGPGWVIDYKTTGSTRYIKKTLTGNVQASIYALSVALEQGITDVTVHWVYAILKWPTLKRLAEIVAAGGEALPETCKGSQAVTEVIDTDSEEFNETFKGIVETAREIRDLRGLKGLEAHDLPPSTGACFNYGGCPYDGICKRKVADYLQLKGKENG